MCDVWWVTPLFRFIPSIPSREQNGWNIFLLFQNKNSDSIEGTFGLMHRTVQKSYQIYNQSNWSIFQILLTYTKLNSEHWAKSSQTKHPKLPWFLRLKKENAYYFSCFPAGFTMCRGNRLRCHIISGFGCHLGLAGWLAGWLAQMASIACEIYLGRREVVFHMCSEITRHPVRISMPKFPRISACFDYE